MQTSQIGEFTADFSGLIGPKRTGVAIRVAFGRIFNNSALIQDKSYGSARLEFPGAASLKLSVERHACDLRLPDTSALRAPEAVSPKRSRVEKSTISRTSGFRSSK